MITNRRQLLKLGGLIAITLSGFPIANRFSRLSDTHEFADKLISLFSDKQSAAVIGRAYLASESSRLSVEHLLALFQEQSGEEILQNMDTERLRNEIANQRQQDFENENVAIVSGWVLSRTEARLCALAALT